ncbi:aldo/keto reductase [Parablautia muri]|uniref:Aldo/keto reductase n=1 Tax=Parablautia muri TaxID=2320879 RepID=A0A9X5GUA9_9FIRM|nr:aldo/keto reductase [Parablautia muri]NBJ94989.1 aldo/keto reductase [Parablautia muri]
MEKRKLGKSELYVNPVGLGCMGFSHASGDPTEKGVAVKMLREAFEIGYDFFDTAEAYIGVRPDGTISYNEELVGEAVKGIRDKVVIATKMGVGHNPDRSLRLDSSPETIRKSVEGSLKKLGTDYIDLYYQHRIDPKVEPEVVAETMGELMKEGKIRYWGISEVTEEYLQRSNAVCPVTAIENRYSMMARWHETIFPVCEELNIAYVAFSPMANGFLTGKYTPATQFEGSQDYRASMPQYTEEGYAKAKELLDMLNKMAAEKNATMGQLSLAWMINKKPYIVPIPGSRKIERLRENFEAGNIFLAKDEIAMIDSKLDTMNFAVFGGHSGK